MDRETQRQRDRRNRLIDRTDRHDTQDGQTPHRQTDTQREAKQTYLELLHAVLY